MAQASNLTPTMWGGFNPTSRTGIIYAKFKNTGSSSISGNIYFVVAEDSIYYVGPNGDPWHNHVARDYLPDELGQAVTIAAGDSIIYSRNFTINAAWNSNKIEIYAWVQQTTGTLECYQACIKKLSELGLMPGTPIIVKPFNYVRVPALQPTLTFYSTDPNSDQIRYRVFWDDNPSFTSPESTTTSDYASGAQVNFTFPSALTNGQTYWWRVKCTDYSGSGIWTEYTASRSLTIGISLPASTCSWFQTTAAQFAANGFDATMIQGDSIILIPAGSAITDTAFFEPFESGAVPAGWTVVDGNSDNYKWSVGTTGDLGSYTPPSYGTYYAYYSDDDAGSGVINNDEAIISPVIRVPTTATTLEFIYGYGIQVYEAGEKMRVKARRKTGSSWSAWNDLAVYTTSGSGTGTFNLTMYLPCDSIQFQWFYSDSTAASHWGYASACDNVVLRYTFPSAGNAGSVTSTAADFHDLSTAYPRQHWGVAVWRKATASDSIMLKFEYNNGSIWQLIPNTALPGNSTGFLSNVVADSVNLSGLDTTTYRTIRMIGYIYRRVIDSPTNPALLDWEMGNLSFFVPVAENTEQNTNPTQLVISPSVVKNSMSIVYTVANHEKPTSIRIYDMTGRVVKTFNITKSSLRTNQTITWNCRDDIGRKLPSGVYFVRLANGENVIVQKTVLLK